MERTVAVKKLAKMLGKGFGYRVDPKAPTAEEREEAKRQLPALKEAREQASKAMLERQRAILNADPEYQQLLAVYKEARKQAAKTQSMLYYHKFTVGVSNSMFFHVKAQGDSWEDVIAKLTNGK